MPFDQLEPGITIQAVRHPFTTYEVLRIEYNSIIVLRKGAEHGEFIGKEYFESIGFSKVEMG